MQHQFESTFKDIIWDTYSLIGRINNLSYGYEDHYSDSLDKMVYDTEPVQKESDGVGIIILLASVFLIIGFSIAAIEYWWFLEANYGKLLLFFTFSPVLYWYLKRKSIQNTKSNIEVSFFLVSDSIMNLEDLYKDYFLRSLNQNSDYFASTQELLDFFHSSRRYFDDIKNRITHLPPTNEANNELLTSVQDETIEWFTKLLALNITFLSDWITKTKLELEKLTTNAEIHATSQESKERSVWKFLLVSLDQHKSYFENIEKQIRIWV